MTPKLLCTVPNCQRGTYRETALKRWGTTRVRFICSSHWRRLTRTEKAVFYRIQRIEKKHDMDLADRRHRIFEALVRRCQQ